ncbi:MAG TPA: methionine--tRNA ligase [Candidatus Dojkabacteria bacterium]|nr:methionine--tRNA ligase [Candidatus Dojkabacteria bacterium]
MNKKILVAVAWPYVNGELHPGHLAGYLLQADIFARYHRLRGNDVLMVSGSDCHGTPITVEADKQKVVPQEIVAKYHTRDIELFNLYNLSYNLYTKTTTDIHKRVVQEMFLTLLKNDVIVKGTMQQYYSPEDQQFLPDRYVEGTCPYCGSKDQRSDQCEICGRWLSDGELIDPHSKLTGKSVELKDTEHYFLDFEKMSSDLKKYLDLKKQVWRKWVWSEAAGWLREGLKKRAITRDMDWAIELPVEEIKKLPGDKQLKDFAGKRIYVWFEAVIGYLSAPQEWVQLKESSGDVIFHEFQGQSKVWKDWWLNKDAEHYYFMGQDNLVFHTLMWPAQLMGAKNGYTLPHNVAVNKFMNLNGAKFSKSRGNIIDSKKLAEKYGVDLVRYYISANLPEHKQANFTWESFADQVNNELVANLGNLINRSLKFLENNFGGAVGESEVQNFTMDKNLDRAIKETYKAVGGHIEKCEFVAGLMKILELSRTGNRYFDQQKIWAVIKSDKNKAGEILINLLNLIENFIVLISPYLPGSAEKLAGMLGEDAETLTPVVGKDKWQAQFRKKFKLVGAVEILFNKLDKEKVLMEKDN